MWFSKGSPAPNNSASNGSNDPGLREEQDLPDDDGADEVDHPVPTVTRKIGWGVTTGGRSMVHPNRRLSVAGTSGPLFRIIYPAEGSDI